MSDITVVCRHCGGSEISTVEDLSGSCGIDIHSIDANGDIDWDYDGMGTEVHWDSSTTTGFQCEVCYATETSLEELIVAEEAYLDPAELAALLGNLP